MLTAIHPKGPKPVKNQTKPHAFERTRTPVQSTKYNILSHLRNLKHLTPPKSDSLPVHPGRVAVRAIEYPVTINP